MQLIFVSIYIHRYCCTDNACFSRVPQIHLIVCVYIISLYTAPLIIALLQVAEMKKTDQARLNAEYQRLVSGLAESGLGRASGGVAGTSGAAAATGASAAGAGGGAGAGVAAGAAGAAAAAADSIPANPVLPADILQEAVPGNIRRAEHFISFMRKVTCLLTARVVGVLCCVVWYCVVVGCGFCIGF